MTVVDSMTWNDKEKGLLLEFTNDEVGAKLIFDDDGKTAYAYLVVDEKTVGDVWLYNVCETPDRPEWSALENMPFANAADFVTEEEFSPIVDSREISVEWEVENACIRQVVLNLRGQRHAVLRPGAKPGWCRLAEKQSPVARPLNEPH